jgi:hypothetical protein
MQLTKSTIRFIALLGIALVSPTTTHSILSILRQYDKGNK